MTTVDLNSDLGEGFGAWSMGDDDAMLGIATSANIACGFHAGDSDIMLKTVKLAKERGVGIGAHPSFRDLHGFGRRPVNGLSASEIESMVAYQIGALQAIAAIAGTRVTHVKPHGALSNIACLDDSVARAIAAAIKGVDRNLIWLVLPHSSMERAGRAAGLQLANEVFADRAYDDDAMLVNRARPGAVLHDVREITSRVIRMIDDCAITATSGKVIKTPIDSICVHSDTPGAVHIARAIRQALESKGCRVTPFHETLKR